MTIFLRQEVTSSREFEAAFCLSADPVNSTNVAVACDDGKIHILDSRLPGDACESLLLVSFINVLLCRNKKLSGQKIF